MSDSSDPKQPVRVLSSNSPLNRTSLLRAAASSFAPQGGAAGGAPQPMAPISATPRAATPQAGAMSRTQQLRPPPPGAIKVPGAPMQVPSANSTQAESQEFSMQFKERIMPTLIQKLDPNLLQRGHEAELREQIEVIVDDELRNEQIPIPKHLRAKLLKEIVDEMVGFGPLEPLLADEAVSEIMVNGPFTIYIERSGKVTLSDVKFMDEAHARRVIDKIITPLGRRIDESSPMVDARLPDGSRVNAIIPPLALDGSTITIRKFRSNPLRIEDLVKYKAISPAMIKFLEAAVHCKMNVVISGGTGSGKTTMLNALSSMIPDGERICTIEDAAELKIQKDHVVRMESRPPNVEGKGAVTIRDLVRNSLRMRPDRVVVGECRAGEALDMLQAMNTGHDGSMTTLHANTARDCLSRMETLVMMAGMDLPQRAIREQIASAVHYIVQISRLSDGSRRVISISEIQGMEGQTITMQDLFRFEQRNVDSAGKIHGELKGMGIVSKYMERFKSMGHPLSSELFSQVMEV